MTEEKARRIVPGKRAGLPDRKVSPGRLATQLHIQVLEQRGKMAAVLEHSPESKP